MLIRIFGRLHHWGHRLVFSAYRIGLAVALMLFLEVSYGEPVSQSSIPFKTEPTPIETHSGRVLGVSLLFLLVMGGLIYGLRKKGIRIGTGVNTVSYVKVLQRTVLNAKTMLYVVEFDQRQVLIMQCGQNVTVISEGRDKQINPQKMMPPT